MLGSSEYSALTPLSPVSSAECSPTPEGQALWGLTRLTFSPSAPGWLPEGPGLGRVSTPAGQQRAHTCRESARAGGALPPALAHVPLPPAGICLPPAPAGHTVPRRGPPSCQAGTFHPHLSSLRTTRESRALAITQIRQREEQSSAFEQRQAFHKRCGDARREQEGARHGPDPVPEGTRNGPQTQVSRANPKAPEGHTGETPDGLGLGRRLRDGEKSPISGTPLK